MRRTPRRMVLHHFTQEQFLPVSREEAWSFFSSPRNLNAITPPELGFRIVHQPGEAMYDGQIIEYRVKIAPLVWIPWVTEIKAVVEGRSFIDEQRSGPYRFWHHRHTFEDAPGGGVLMRDLIHYAVGMGPFGEIAHALFVRRKLDDIFAFRRRILAERFGGQ